jgi:hypothetical protein
LYVFNLVLCKTLKKISRILYTYWTFQFPSQFKCQQDFIKASKVHIFWKSHKNMTKPQKIVWRLSLLNNFSFFRFCQILAAFWEYMNFKSSEANRKSKSKFKFILWWLRLNCEHANSFTHYWIHHWESWLIYILFKTLLHIKLKNWNKFRILDSIFVGLTCLRYGFSSKKKSERIWRKLKTHNRSLKLLANWLTFQKRWHICDFGE